MHRKFIALAVVLAIFLIALNFHIISRTISGFATLTEQISISLAVLESTEGKIIYFLYPSYVVEDNPAGFIVNFKNTGNQNITGRIEIRIANSTNQTVASLYDSNFTLAPLEMDSFFTTWSPSELGNYYVSARVPYDNKTAEENRSFEVISSTPVTLPPAPYPIYYPVGPAPALPVPAVINLTLDYPKLVNLTQGESSLISVDAFNLGNVDLHNLSLSATAERLILNVHPKEVSVLKAQASTTFLISVEVPIDAAVKDYAVSFSVSSEEVTEKGEITINVLLLEVYKEVEQSIENYASLIDKMLGEIQKAVAEERNVTLALENLNKAKKEFDVAKGLFESKDYEGAKQRLLNVKTYLEKTIVELARTIKVPKPPIIPPEYIPFINVTLVTLTVLLILIAYKELKESKLYRRRIAAAIKEMKK